MKRLARRIRVLVTGCPVCGRRRKHLMFCVFRTLPALMASRNRTCHHLVPSTHISVPPPHQLATLGPVLGTLIDAAAEFDSFDERRWTAVEFVQWLDVTVREIAARSREGVA
jgi:hypothetical protein